MASSDYKIYDLYQNEDNHDVWWVDTYDRRGEYIFTFDKEHFFNFFSDCPQNLTQSQWEIFKREEPALARLKESNEEKTKID
ncbi:MAG: hypothetical protein MR008_03280 [Aerococcus sp.]|nr:hypothetical protein [Aerococcus sp.]